VQTVFLGATASMLITGLLARSQASFDHQAIRPVTTLSICLLPLAFGVFRQRQWMERLIAVIGVRQNAGRTRAAAISPNDSTRATSLHNAVFLFGTLSLGILIALTPLQWSILRFPYSWLQRHFVWSDIPQAIMHGALLLLAGTIPLIGLGFLISTQQRMAGATERRRPSVTGLLLLGAAAGQPIVSLAMKTGVSNNAFLPAAALPCLFVAIMEAWRLPGGRSATRANATNGPPLPTHCDVDVHSIRRTLLLLIGFAAIACSSWIGPSESNEHGPDGWHEGWFPLSVGLGVLLGERIRRAENDMLRFAISSTASGFFLIFLFIFPMREGLSHSILHPCCMTAGLFLVGAAYSAGTTAILERVADRFGTGDSIIFACLLSVSTALWIGDVFPFDALVRVLALTLAAVVLIRGISLIYREKSHQPGSAAFSLRNIAAVWIRLAVRWRSTLIRSSSGEPAVSLSRQRRPGRARVR